MLFSESEVGIETCSGPINVAMITNWGFEEQRRLTKSIFICHTRDERKLCQEATSIDELQVTGEVSYESLLETEAIRAEKLLT